MATIEQKIKQFEEMENGLPLLIMDLSKERESEILDLVRSQLDEGKRSDDKIIKPKYKPYTVRVKKFKGQPTDRVTLRDTGDFYESIEVDFFSSHFSFFATDWKRYKLEKKYGHEILGLSEDSTAKLSEFIKDRLLEEIKKKVL